ncbi:MAG TPA: alpha/beta hydrolase [Flavobacterium sp.]|jgi:pimeloyl-ACP methyl ester carboxylesterase
MQNLLLLHGALGSQDQFNQLVDNLQDTFITYTLNFAGHGGAIMPEAFSIGSFGEDVINFIKSNNLAPIHIFGYSMGGYVALDVAKRYPDLIDRIFTFATKFQWSPEIAEREIRMLNADKIMEKIPAFAEQLAARHSPNDWRLLLKKTAAFMETLGDSSPLKLDHIQKKVRIGIGDKDAMVSLEESIDAFRKLPDASLIVFPETQHPIEKISTERLATEIKKFFS